MSLRTVAGALALLSACSSVESPGARPEGGVDPSAATPPSAGLVWVAPQPGRDELVPLDTCVEAVGGVALAPGSYYGGLASLGADLDLSDNLGCTGYDALGRDGLLRIDLAAGELLTVDYDLVGFDGSAYLLEDCADATTCVAGSDQVGTGVAESLQYYAAAATTLYLGLDQWKLDVTDADGDLFLLDVAIEAAALDTLADTCVDALDDARFSDGAYLFSFTGHTNDLDVDAMGSSIGGVDAFLPIKLRRDELLTVTTTTPDVLMYALKEDCGPDSAVARSAEAGFTPATLTYLNRRDRSGVVMLGFDVATGATPPGLVDFDVTIENIGLDAADSCADAQVMSPVADGEYAVSLWGRRNHLNSQDSRCAFVETTGADVMFPVDIAAGSTFDIDLLDGADNTVVYLVTDCNTSTTCFGGVVYGLGGDLSWFNDTGVDQHVYVVFDTTNHSFESAGVRFVMSREVYVPVVVPDTCPQAKAAAPYTTGTYAITSDLATRTNNLDGSTCTGFEHPGNDGIVPIRLSPGESVVVDYSTSNDGALLLLSDCANVATCLVGNDQIAGSEHIEYTNTSGVAERLYLVADSYLSGGTDFFMTFTIE